MKKYQVTFVVEVKFYEGFDRDVIRMEVSSSCKENAALECFKTLDLDTIKFIRKETLRKQNRTSANDWSAAITFDLLDCKVTVKKEEE